MKVASYWKVVLKINGYFGGTNFLHLQGPRILQARNHHEAGTRVVIRNIFEHSYLV
jgi:hypothetical protein